MNRGMIGHLVLEAAPNGEGWQLVRKWKRSGNPGVKFDPVVPWPDPLVGDWAEVEEPAPDECQWILSLPGFGRHQEPSFQTLEDVRESLGRSIEAARANKSAIKEEELEQLDEAVIRLANVLMKLDAQGRGVGFFCPASVNQLPNGKLFLSDFGFRFDRQRSGVPPEWLKNGDEHVYPYEILWDRPPKGTNARDNIDAMLDGAEASSALRAHDQRTFARLVAWLLVGQQRCGEWWSTHGGRLPTTDRAPEIQGKAVWKWIAELLNDAGGVSWTWPQLVERVKAAPPSTHFRKEPPPPPTPPRPFPWIKALLGLAVIGGAYGLWHEWNTIFPPPLPPLTLCKDCPGSSALREPAEELAKLWKSKPASTVAIDQELKLLEAAHTASRSTNADIKAREEECLAALRRTFDGRLYDVCRLEFDELQGADPDIACPRIKALRNLAVRLKSLMDGSATSSATGGESATASSDKASPSRLETPTCLTNLDGFLESYSCPQ